jgi:two-component system aerobic respiration control sensor histidine kinase ArcB
MNASAIYLENIVNNLPHFIFWKDRDSRFVGCNQLFAKAAGFTSFAEIIGKSDYDMPWKAKAAEYIKTDQDIIANALPQTSYEEEQPQKDGSIATMLVSKVPVFDECQNVVGVLCIYMDITERKTMEKNLILAKEKAEAANEAKEAFLRNMRHDLRTPFSGILTLSQWMTEKEADPEKRKNLQCIADSALILLEYMNTLLDHAQLGVRALEISISSINLEKLLQEALLTIMPVIVTKRLQLSLHYPESLPKMINSDVWRLQRIVLNLLGNAVKFTHEGHIEMGVDIITHQSQNITLAIWIKDTGIGVPVEKREAIFEKFTRLEAAYTGKYSGAGLGLHDVKQLCQELGGDVVVTNNGEQGSIFTCTLPFTIDSPVNSLDVPSNDSAKKVTTSHTSHNIKILLVEDQPIAAHVAAEILRSHGYGVEIAETGMKALEKFTDRQYDVVLMDIGLPDMDGIMLAHKMRQFESANQKRSTPIIALTAHKNDGEYDLKIFDKIFKKPFSSSIIDNIEQQCKQSR